MVRRKLAVFPGFVPVIGIAIAGWMVSTAVHAAQGIVFVSNRTGNKEIWRMDADGGHPTQLTFSAGLDAEPVPSPDGMWIAYVSDVSGEQEIYLIDQLGRAEPKRLSDDGRFKSGLCWSPDSTKLLGHHLCARVGQGVQASVSDGLGLGEMGER